MSFNDNASLDLSQVESGGGGRGRGRGPMMVGGGVGGIIIAIVLALLGFNSGGGTDPTGDYQQNTSQLDTGGDVGSNAFSQCKTGSDANRDDTCLSIATVNSVQGFWSTELPKHGVTYTPSKAVIYRGQTQSACGTASNQVGPFYCPLDQKVYLDASFFQLLQQQFGADNGQLAKEYVIAHEYGHHIQDILGLLDRAQREPQGAQSGAVRVELMADCLGGVWIKHATETTDKNGVQLIEAITEDDLRSALSGAKAVGDDHIQSTMGSGQVNPESWTHGSSQARQRWLLQGYQTGDINQCNTFAVNRVE